MDLFSVSHEAKTQCSRKTAIDNIDTETTLNDRSQMTVKLVLHKLKKTILGGMTKLKGQKLEKCTTVLKTDVCQDDEHSESSPNNYGTFDNMIETLQCQDLIVQIKHALASMQKKENKTEILIPCGLVSKIARDIMHMASKEPCGLRGCVLFINLEEKDKCKTLIKLDCDPNTVSTFELFLTLKEDTRGWCLLKKFFISMSGCLEKKPWTTELKLLCSGYQLEKKKLYRLNC